MLTLLDLLRIPHLEVRNLRLAQSTQVKGVSTDTRSLSPGDVFFALKGERFDGHRFVNKAFEDGAVLAVVERGSEAASHPAWPVLVVESTTTALGDLAGNFRSRFSIPVLAIGGSNGKTTTKEMVARTLGMKYRVLKTEGNHNNHIGVPMTLLGLRSDHQVAVVEIGTNHPGEVAALCRVLDPTHGLVTTIGREHLEFFGTIRRVASEEGTLYRYLRARDRSTAFVNVDDRHVVTQAKGIRRTVRYGFDNRAARIRGHVDAVDSQGHVRFRFVRDRGTRGTAVDLRIPGMHNAMNALAAAAVGIGFGVPAGKIREALEGFTAFKERMEVVESAGVTIINDTYNANPDSVIAALRTLAAIESPGKKIVVLADMRELGEQSEKQHRLMGQQVGRLGFDHLLTFGEQARHLHEAARVRFKVHYDQKNVLAEYLLELLSAGDAVLVKGSRGMAMEDVVTFLRERLASPKTGVQPVAAG
jgi:UDP-N-acetylmuramoyl-tripeptide--D-alanyl-D-alanine ligase